MVLLVSNSHIINFISNSDIISKIYGSHVHDAQFNGFLLVLIALVTNLWRSPEFLGQMSIKL